MANTMGSSNEIAVWDPLIRGFHWATVLLCLLNLFILEEGERNHRYVGYALAGLLLLRILWGLVGADYARFAQWFPTPARITRYLQATLQGKHPYYLGHNPLGALMVLLLLGCLVGTAVTGIMTEYEQLFNEELMEELHEFFAKALQIAIFIHVLAVIVLDRLTRGDLIRAMVTGKKRVPTETEIADKR
ncbi:cytochrome b [Aeromonas sp. BIGb0405]|nr:cytochrome b [Aeromonas sp. BIGb0405]